MKFKFFVMLILFSFLSIMRLDALSVPTLQDISNSFNNNPDVLRSNEIGFNLESNVFSNKLRIVNKVEKEAVFDFILDDNILTLKLNEYDFIGLLIGVYVIDSIEHLHGYEYGELYTTLNSERVRNYRLENEGVEINEKYIKIDISKKIPMLDFSDDYFTTQDLEVLKEYISGDGSAEQLKEMYIITSLDMMEKIL